EGDHQLPCIKDGPMELAPEQLDYMQVAITTGVGPCLLGRLLEHFGTATDILSASPQQLSQVEGVGVGLARRLRSSEFRDATLLICDDCRQRSIRILFPGDAEFPRLLQEIADPPSLLYIRGQLLP